MSDQGLSIFDYFTEQTEKLSAAIEEAQEIEAEATSRTGNVRVRARATGEVTAVTLSAESMRLSPERLGAIIIATANAAREKSAAGAEDLMDRLMAVQDRLAYHLDMESPEVGNTFRNIQNSIRPQQVPAEEADDEEGYETIRRSWLEQL